MYQGQIFALSVSNAFQRGRRKRRKGKCLEIRFVLFFSESKRVTCDFSLSLFFSYVPIVSEALEMASAASNTSVVVFQRPGLPEADLKRSSKLFSWQEEINRGSPRHDCVDVEANDPLYILYTSGTTGKDNSV